MSAKRIAMSFLAGLVFALGLGLGGMTQPAKVIGFLDVAGAWDPSLAFVMMGAIGVHAVFVRRARGADRRPILAEHFAWPEAMRIDGRLLAGAAIFGLGWGALGYCPGPALVSLASGAPRVILFVASMLVGMAAVRALRDRRATSDAPVAAPSGDPSRAS